MLLRRSAPSVMVDVMSRPGPGVAGVMRQFDARTSVCRKALPCNRCQTVTVTDPNRSPRQGVEFGNYDQVDADRPHPRSAPTSPGGVEYRTEPNSIV